VVEDERFGRAMEAMYIDDLGNATEILIERRRRVRPADASRHPRKRGSGGSANPRRRRRPAHRQRHRVRAHRAAGLRGRRSRRLFVQGGSILAVISLVAFVWPPLLPGPWVRSACGCPSRSCCALCASATRTIPPPGRSPLELSGVTGRR
jgi:cardiolipin synthase